MTTTYYLFFKFQKPRTTRSYNRDLRVLSKAIGVLESPLLCNGQFEYSVHILEVLALTYHPVINAISINNLLGCRLLGTMSQKLTISSSIFLIWPTSELDFDRHASIVFTVNVKNKVRDLKLSKWKSLLGLLLYFFLSTVKVAQGKRWTFNKKNIQYQNLPCFWDKIYTTLKTKFAKIHWLCNEIN